MVDLDGQRRAPELNTLLHQDTITNLVSRTHVMWGIVR
jgi:hypothetical protein